MKALVGAVYAEKSFQINDRTALELGARAEYTDYHYDNRASTGRIGRFIRAADRSDNFFTLTPKASLSFVASDTAQLYLRAARGSRAPQVTDLYSAQQNQVPGQADVETLDSIEAGMKFDNRNWQVELAGYAMWKDNFFFRNANGFNVVNGQTKHIGAEMSFSGQLTDWLSISGDWTLAEHSYNFTEIVGSVANDIIAGTRVDTAPDTLAHLRLTATPNDKILTEIEWRHVGSYFTNPGNTASYPGHNIFILRSAYDVTEEIKLFGRIDNLFDTRYADRADFAFGNERYFPGRPRTLFFGLSSQF